MSFKPRYFALLLVAAGAVASIAVTPIAAGDPPNVPQPGSESATATINDLAGMGYNVQINWVNGNPDVSLSQCWVNGIDTAAAPTAYVDIECPK
jgi:hypothetical protein